MGHQEEHSNGRQIYDSKARIVAGMPDGPEIFEQVIPRLETFMAPFVESFQRQEPEQHAQTYV
jgi:hypothetical protein